MKCGNYHDEEFDKVAEEDPKLKFMGVDAPLSKDAEESQDIRRDEITELARELVSLNATKSVFHRKGIS